IKAVLDHSLMHEQFLTCVVVHKIGFSQLRLFLPVNSQFLAILMLFLESFVLLSFGTATLRHYAKRLPSYENAYRQVHFLIRSFQETNECFGMYDKRHEL